MEPFVKIAILVGGHLDVDEAVLDVFDLDYNRARRAFNLPWPGYDSYGKKRESYCVAMSLDLERITGRDPRRCIGTKVLGRDPRTFLACGPRSWDDARELLGRLLREVDEMDDFADELRSMKESVEALTNKNQNTNENFEARPQFLFDLRGHHESGRRSRSFSSKPACFRSLVSGDVRRSF